MSIATLRPNTVIANPNNGFSGGWTYDATATFIDTSTVGKLADNSDSTSASNSGANGFGTLVLGMSTFSLPAGAVIQSVTPRIRDADSTNNPGGNPYNYYGIQQNDGAGAIGNSSHAVAAGPANYVGTVHTVRPSDGGAWTQADIDVLSWFANLPSWHSTAQITIYEAYIDVIYTPAPPSNLQRTSLSTVTTPSFSADLLESSGNQVKARYELYQNDGVTLIGTIDSAYITSNGTVSATYGSALPVGNYKVRAQTIDSSGYASAWTALTSFQINTAVTKDQTFLWDVATPTTPVSKDSTYLWNVDELKAKQFGLVWTVYSQALKDLTLLWNVNTPWVKVIDDVGTVWTGVPEG